jgi:hypothetical protein
MGRLAGNVRQFAGDTCGLVPCVRGGGRDQGASQLYGRRSLLSQTFAIGALMLPDVAWGQATETLPEVTVSAPRPAPVRRAAPTARPARSTLSARVSAPAPSRPSPPVPAPQIPAFQAVATTPVTGLGVDRDKISAMVQTLPAADFSRSAFPASPPTTSRATNSPRTYATGASRHRRCKARRKGSPSTCKVSASMRPLAIPSTGT